MKHDNGVSLKSIIVLANSRIASEKGVGIYRMSTQSQKNLCDKVVTLNGRLQAPWQIGLNTFALTVGFIYGAKFVKNVQKEGLLQTLLRPLIKTAQSIPGVRGMVDKEVKKTFEQIERQFRDATKDDVVSELSVKKLPKEGIDQSVVLEVLQSWNSAEYSRWEAGQESGTVYHG
eukprot:652293_1